MTKTAIALRHVGFEDVGSFGDVLADAGYTLRYHDVGVDRFAALDPLDPDLFVVLGGPIGVYQDEAYPFLRDEIALVRKRLAAAAPVLGICLGAQLMASALGAEVVPMGGVEIGFAPLTLTPEGAGGPLRHLRDVPVLHWHGDRFEYPADATPLASTPACAQQAFAIGETALALQFHPELDPDGFERWLIGHAVEIAEAGLDPTALRADARAFGPALRDAGRDMFGDWLAGLPHAAAPTGGGGRKRGRSAPAAA